MGLPSLQEWAAVADRVGPAVLAAAAGSVALLGLAGLAAAAMRRASAAARHEVWVLGFAGTLLLPVLSAALPGWHVLPLPGAGRPAPRAAEVVSVAASPPPASAQPAGQPAARRPSADPSPNRETVTKAEGELPGADSPPPPPPPAVARVPVVPAQVNPIVPPAALPGPPRAERSESPSWTNWLLLCWPVGSLLVLGRLAAGHLSLWSLRRRCSAVTGGEWFDLLGRLRRELGLRRPVELLSSPGRDMPMTWGLWRARLLVPGRAADWPAGQRRDVLLHELGHVRRWDCLTHLLSQVACAAYWFNPLAWVADRRMRVERERACDDLVLNSGAEAASYAKHLLQSVSSVPALRLAGAAVAMARPSTLEERMHAILNPRLNRRGLTARGSVAATLLLASVLVPAAVLKAQQGPAPEPRPAAGDGSARAAGVGNDGPPATRPARRLTTRPATRPAGADPLIERSSGFGGGRTSAGFGDRAAAPALGAGPTCTLDATLYDVRIPVDQIGKLDADALAKAAETAEGFERALAALGAAKPMYRANQSVRLSGDTVTIGSEVPMVTNTRLTDKGQTINTVQYQSTGARFVLAGKAGAQGGVDLDLGIEVSSFSDNGAAITDKVNVPVMRRATLSHKGPVEPRKPFVVVSVDAGSADKDGKAVAYIGRITMGEPRSPAEAGGQRRAGAAAAPAGADVVVVVPLRDVKAADAGKMVDDLVRDTGPKVTVDDRTNSLLLRGDKARVEAVQAVLGELDRPASTPPGRPTR